MASFGAINAAAASFRPEATNALININLELNLFTKRLVEPPREYNGVGHNLTPSRRHEAQEGTRHALARTLGILFKDRDILPQTPELIKAYGSRASEIAQNSVANPRGNSSHGAFEGMVGADATTLWAAATSGRSAIQCHLLACLLARIWEPAEATSIWVEIVTKRKAELKSRLIEEGELDQDVLLAIVQDIPRSELRDWDASARAWIRVADAVMIKQQKQLRIIIDNLSIPVNLKPDTYDSVITAWSSAMTQMEKLLNGVPLQVVNGEILLGLLSWHLYPDMKHISRDEKQIEQHDPLLHGRGILTLGLEPSPRIAKDCQSVYWALPLSHLRYYGRLPVTKTTSLRTSDRDRITIDEMLWAMVSAYILSWDDGSIPTPQVLQFISDMAVALNTEYDFDRADRKTHRGKRPEHQNRAGKSWLIMISKIIKQYQDHVNEERVRKIGAMGQRFCKIFGAPFQGIFNTSTYLKVARNLEDKIWHLRETVASVQSTQNDPWGYEFIITYKLSLASYVDIAIQQSGSFRERFEYATAFPEARTPIDPKASCDTKRRHRRWLSFGPHDILDIAEWEAAKSRMNEVNKSGEEVRYFHKSTPIFERHHKRDTTRNNNTKRSMIIINDPIREAKARAKQGLDKDFVSMVAPTGHDKIIFDLVVGDMESIALLQRRRPVIIIDPMSSHAPPKQMVVNQSQHLPVQRVIKLFHQDSVNLSYCSKELDMGAYHNITLLAMTFVKDLYDSMEGATVDVRAVQFDFTESLWVNTLFRRLTHLKPNVIQMNRRLESLSVSDADSAICFACIAMMETGSYNINPDELQNVFAIGAADSLYVASALLQDPASKTLAPVKRFTGNIGRAGMAFMVPPKDPEIKSYNDINEWHQYEHKEFDGKLEDCFKGTSLHISFSEASQALNVDFSGGRDIDAYFLETLISVHIREVWIAELDILGAFRSPQNRLVRDLLDGHACEDHESSIEGFKLISIDNFAEMIVPPKQAGIVRATGNWQARLAAASICLAKGYKVILKPKGICWGCLSRHSVAGLTVGSVPSCNNDVVVII